MGMMCDGDYLCGKAIEDLLASYREPIKIIGRSGVRTSAGNALEMDANNLADYYDSTDDFFRALGEQRKIDGRRAFPNVDGVGLGIPRIEGRAEWH